MYASKNQKVTLPDVPKVKGYTNLGWTTEKGETEPEDVYKRQGFICWISSVLQIRSLMVHCLFMRMMGLSLSLIHI